MVIVIRTKGARVGVAHEDWSRSEEGTARPALAERVEMSDWACAPRGIELNFRLGTHV